MPPKRHKRRANNVLKKFRSRQSSSQNQIYSGPGMSNRFQPLAIELEDDGQSVTVVKKEREPLIIVPQKCFDRNLI